MAAGRAADPGGDRPVAQRIAEIAEKNFLVAGLIARTHGLHDDVAVRPEDIAVTSTVDAAFHRYLDRIPDVGTIPARELLTVLAFAESPGWTAPLWAVAIGALTAHHPTGQQVTRFARGPAATFLIESARGDADPTYRLFHQALVDTLRTDRARLAPEVVDERALTRSFLALGTRTGWEHVPAYLLRSLPGYAQRAGLIDDVLAVDDYLLRADLHRLIPAADRATTPSGKQRAHLLHLTPHAVAAGPAERAALFSVTAALEGHDKHTTRQHVPYRGVWSRGRHRTERARLDGHTGGVSGVCAVQVDDQMLLASAGADRTVRVWDPATGRPTLTVPVHHEALSVAALAMGRLAVGLFAGVLVLELTAPSKPR